MEAVTQPRLTPEEYRELADDVDRYARENLRHPSPQWMAARIAEVVARRPKTKRTRKGAKP